MDSERAIRQQYDDASNLDARIALHRRFSTATTPWHDWVRERVGPLDGLRVNRTDDCNGNAIGGK